MTQHTPTPWYTPSGIDSGLIILAADGSIVARIEQRGRVVELAEDDPRREANGWDASMPETEANADLIIRGANLHGYFVEAAKAALRQVEDGRQGLCGFCMVDRDDCDSDDVSEPECAGAQLRRLLQEASK